MRELRAYRLDNTAVLPSGLQARMSVIKVLITLDVAPGQRSGSLSVENDWEAAKIIV